MVKPKALKKAKPTKKQTPKTKKKIVKREKKQPIKTTKKAPTKPKAAKNQSKFYTTDLVKPTEEQIKAFEQYTQGLKKKEVQSKESYHLYEDLLIILEVVKLMKENTEEKSNFWMGLMNKNILKRSQESMRDRFKRQLRYLTAKDYVTICQHLKEQQDCSGYLEFQFVALDKKKGKFLNSVTLEDPRLIKNPSAEKAK